MSRHTVAGFLFVAALLGGIALSAQSAQPARASSDELLTEIRGLRADINKVMASSVKAQLLVGRLQLQEQRINAINAQIARLTTQIVTREADAARQSADAERWKKMMSDLGVPEEQRKQLAAMMTMSLTQVAAEQTATDQLKAQIIELSSQLQQEEARWTFFNDGLDQIDAALQPPQRGR